MEETFTPSTQFSLTSISEEIGGEVRAGTDVLISGIGRIEFAKEGEITFLSSERYAKFLPLTKASAVIVGGDLVSSLDLSNVNAIVVDDAHRAFSRVVRKFVQSVRTLAQGVSEFSFIHPSAEVSESATVSAGCVVGKGCTIAENVQLHPGVVLYPGCKIGAETIVHGNVVCYAETKIGERCIIHAGAVLGSDGFGYFENSDGSFEKIPHVGDVVIGNDVEIGANSTIDRAAVGHTMISDGVKIDNLVHIAHNVVVGANTAVAAQAGISGSAKIGERNRIAGQVGVVGHIYTVPDVIVEAQSGVSKSISSPGAYFGSPAKEHRTTLRIEAALRQLPDILREFRDLKTEVEELKKKSSE